MKTKDAVVLVPGFLGFSRFGDFYYFADRVSATLRGALELRLACPVPVIPVTTLPTAGLAARQQVLLDALAKLEARLGGVERFHLVGHSAGGLDAQLLTCHSPLRRTAWSLDEGRLCAKIASVCTVAGAHHGTDLSTSPIAQFAVDPIHHADALAVAPKLVVDFLKLVPRGPAFANAVSGALLAPPEVIKFVSQLVAQRELVSDLRPRHVEGLRRENPPTGRTPLKSFVTVVPREVLSDSDRFFADLCELTDKGDGALPSETVLRGVERLNAARNTIVASKRHELTFDARVSDGVVNSARQLLDPSSEDELAGIFVADHADILGHYDRTDALIDDRPLNAGIFHSGAGFGDEQFFELYRRIAEIIAAHAR